MVPRKELILFLFDEFIPEGKDLHQYLRLLLEELFSI